MISSIEVMNLFLISIDETKLRNNGLILQKINPFNFQYLVIYYAAIFLILINVHK